MGRTSIQSGTEHLLSVGIFHIQLSIEDLKANLKRVVNGICRGGLSEFSAIHGLQELRRELEMFEYMQELVDQDIQEISTIETVSNYLKQARNRDNN